MLFLFNGFHRTCGQTHTWLTENRRQKREVGSQCNDVFVHNNYWITDFFLVIWFWFVFHPYICSFVHSLFFTTTVSCLSCISSNQLIIWEPLTEMFDISSDWISNIFNTLKEVLTILQRYLAHLISLCFILSHSKYASVSSLTSPVLKTLGSSTIIREFYSCWIGNKLPENVISLFRWFLLRITIFD